MAITFDYSGKPTYMFQAGNTSTDGVWYAVGAKIDTAAGYEWAGAQTFLNTVTTDATVILRDGFNNFLNPAARDAALTAPVAGTLVFVRQDSGGSPLNQIQFYNGTAWVANDGDINGVTAGTGLSGGGTSGTVTLSVDTTVVATTSNTLTMSGKTLTTPTINGASITGSFTSSATITGGTYSGATLSGTLTAGGGVGTNGQYLQSTSTGVQWATVTGYSAPTLGSTALTSGATITTISGLTDIVLNGPGSIKDELTLIMMGAL
jgi:hypothetical protein